MSDYRTPPALTSDMSYERWKQEIEVWQLVTKLEPEKQAGAILLSLEGNAREAALEIGIAELKKADTGVQSLLTKLDSLYAKDTLLLSIDAYKNFEKFQRPVGMKISEYKIEFEKRYNRAKKYKMTVDDGVLAYRFLESANLTESQQELVRGTIDDMTYAKVTKKMSSLFLETSSAVAEGSHLPVKLEPTFLVGNSSQNYGNRGAYQGSGRNNSNFSGSGAAGPGGSNRSVGYTAGAAGTSSGNNRNSYGGPGRRRFNNSKFRKNPRGVDGEQTFCHNCHSSRHYVSDCPEPRLNYSNNEDNVTMVCKVPAKQSLVGEALGAVVLDSACPRDVAGEFWVQSHIETLGENDLADVVVDSSDASFQFGDGQRTKSKKRVSFPAYLSGKREILSADIVAADIPFLLSEKTMRDLGMMIDFGKREVFINNVLQKRVYVSSTGHYCLPIGKHFDLSVATSDMPLITSVVKLDADVSLDEPIVWLVKDIFVSDMTRNEKMKMAKKLHRQFSHADKRLKMLLTDAGVKDEELFQIIDEVVRDCESCIKYKKGSPRPVVGFSMGYNFNQTVAMDLKEYTKSSNKLWFLHMIDTSSRYSAACVINSKKKEVVLAGIFKIWITVFGTPEKILVDNGGEFNNEDFRDFCENYNIRIRTTAAESPWSNGTVERHNAVVGESVDKIMYETRCSLDIALAWAVSAKNSLLNVHGYSPNQLVFGKNPNYPCVISNYPPALEGRSISEVVASNLNAMHSARENFIRNESSSKIRKALHHQVRPSGNVKYFLGDEVFYKRLDSKEWKGPASVIGQDGQQVILKHGSIPIRVHPCKLKLFKEASGTKTNVLSFSDCCNENGCEIAGKESVQVPQQDKGSTTAESVLPEDSSNAVDSSDSDSAEVEESTPHSSSSNVNPVSVPSLKRNMGIKYAMSDNPGEWLTGRVVRRTGKASGKYKNFWEVETENGTKVEIDFENDLSDWEPLVERNHSAEEVLFVDGVSKAELLLEAKAAEIQNWKDNNVYDVVPYVGQSCISTRWVITEKVVGSEVKQKARLVARGFEEKSADILKDSPTCSKQCFRLMLTIVVSKGWDCHCIDVKAAFLQGKMINRDVYLLPPREYSKTGFVWKLKKCVYGLTDASRTWYLRVKEELLNLNVQVSKFDCSLFYWWYEGELQGLLTIHVDDICWGGSPMFQEKVIKPLYNVFQIGSESSSSFVYLGLNLQQNTESIHIDQYPYVQGLVPIELDRNRKRDEKLNSSEQSSLRRFVGQMNWLATQTRPDILFDCCSLMSSVSSATVGELHKANKCLNKVKNNDVQLVFQKLDDVKNVEFKVFSDASFNNLIGGGSQGGFVIFLCSNEGILNPIHWQSNRLQRVVKSTFAAETLAFTDAAESAFWLKTVYEEIIPSAKCRISCFTDNKSLHQSVYSTTVLKDKRLQVDLAVLREMLFKTEIESVKWIDTSAQLADCLTKDGANSDKLLQVLASGKYVH